MRKSLLTAAAAFAVAGGAMTLQTSAADLDYMPAPVPAPPPFVPIWQGFYIGGHVGYGEADFGREADVEYFEFNELSEEFEPGILNTFRSSASADGLIGGVQGGYNWQVNALVFGIEGDISFADWSQSSVAFDRPLDQFGIAADVEGIESVEVDFLASVRGRLGMAFGNALLYGTGGLAWADAEARMRVDRVDDGGDVENLWTRSADFDDLGFVVGGGFAWMVIPRTFSVGVEGLYYFFDEEKTLFDDTVVHVNDDEVDVRVTASLDDAWVIRARADFHF
jgi:outer membrane immunogenic protein